MPNVPCDGSTLQRLRARRIALAGEADGVCRLEISDRRKHPSPYCAVFKIAQSQQVAVSAHRMHHR